MNKTSMRITGAKSTMKAVYDAFTQQSDAHTAIQSLRLLGALQEATPKDTGFAAGSWKFIKAAKGFKLLNTAPYIDRLNAGSSRQAPAHFVEVTALKYGVPKGAIVTYK